MNKENWALTTAKRVKEAYFNSLTPAGATAFLDFFGNTTLAS